MISLRSHHIALLVRIVAAAAIVIILAGVFLLPIGAPDASNLTRYAGRFHILALHVPIGVLMLAMTAESVTLLRRYRRYGDLVVGFALPLLVVTGCAAILLGLSLAHGGDYPAKLAAKHRNLTSAGIIVAALATIAWPYRKRAVRWGHRALLGLAALLISIGAHFGGSMTHGADYLFAPLDPKATPTKDAKDPDATDLSADAGPTADVAVVDAGSADAATASTDAGIADASAPREAGAPAKATPKQIVQAMVGRRCAPCHTTNSKGGLRLTSLDPSKMKANEVVPGDPGSSRMYERLTLPRDDEYHMPPEKEAQPSKGEINAVRQWITDLGAPP